LKTEHVGEIPHQKKSYKLSRTAGDEEGGSDPKITQTFCWKKVAEKRRGIPKKKHQIVLAWRCALATGRTARCVKIIAG